MLVQGIWFKARLPPSSLSLVFNKGLVSVSKLECFQPPSFRGVSPCSTLATVARGSDGAPSCLGFCTPAASPLSGSLVAALAPRGSGLISPSRSVFSSLSCFSRCLSGVS